MNQEILMIEFVENGISMVAMFNATRITESEVHKMILNGEAHHSNLVIVIYKEQYLNLLNK